MSIFKNIKAIFIEPDPEITEDPSIQPSAKTGSEPTLNQTPENSTQSSKNITETNYPQPHVEEKFLNIFYDAMEKQGKEGFDYLEFKQSLTSLAKLSMDEQTRYQSAFAVAQTMGATTPSLIDAANYYLNILSNEEKSFESTLKSQMQKQIGDKEKETQTLKAGIAEKATQIEKLKKEIEDHNKQLASMQQQITDAANKIETTKQNFQASYNQIANQIKEDINKMQQYLK